MGEIRKQGRKVGDGLSKKRVSKVKKKGKEEEELLKITKKKSPIRVLLVVLLRISLLFFASILRCRLFVLIK